MVRFSSRALLLLVLVVLVGCRPKADDQVELAANAAKLYYDYLLEGKYDCFVDGMNQPDSIPDSYRRNLISSTRMFMEQQKAEHQGIRETTILDVVVNEQEHTANVFLAFSYGDGTVEQVLVPMVCRNGLWLMR